ncbi:MAG: cytochrome c biogenesis protein ResB [Opitutae bacterium]|nr:cytochrome c biogenesis protein ResB [Opitutae bacterium]
MPGIIRQLRDFFVSIRLTVVLLIMSMILVFAATLAQVELGVWGVQQKYFHSFFVMQVIPQTGITVPAFPGGYLIGGLLLINLLAAHIYRFKLEWRKSGIQLTHAGLILLLVGELLTGLLAEESLMRIDEGQTKHYSESYRQYELALLDLTNPAYNDVVAIPEMVLAETGTIQHPQLPFQVKIKDYYPNASLQRRSPAPETPPARATAGIGPSITAIPLPLNPKENEGNLPVAFVELVGTEGTLGTWLVSPALGQPQTLTYQGHTWELTLRQHRYYQTHAVKLLNFTHEKYAGTDIPKNFASRIQLTTDNKSEDREVLIYMNNPLRYAGLTYFQAGFENNDRTSILQVVRNPNWILPYIACLMMGLGLLIQFGIHLVSFSRKRSAV